MDRDGGPAERKLHAIQNEAGAKVGHLLRLIVTVRRETGSFHWEALEQSTCAAIHRGGERLLQKLPGESGDNGEARLCAT